MGEGECSQVCTFTLIFSGIACWTQAGGFTVVTSSILGERGRSCRISGKQVDLEVARSLCRGEERGDILPLETILSRCGAAGRGHPHIYPNTNECTDMHTTTRLHTNITTPHTHTDPQHTHRHKYTQQTHCLSCGALLLQALLQTPPLTSPKHSSCILQHTAQQIAGSLLMRGVTSQMGGLWVPSPWSVSMCCPTHSSEHESSNSWMTLLARESTHHYGTVGVGVGEGEEITCTTM